MVEFIKAVIIVILFFMIGVPFVIWLLWYAEWCMDKIERIKRKKEEIQMKEHSNENE